MVKKKQPSLLDGIGDEPKELKTENRIGRPPKPDRAPRTLNFDKGLWRRLRKISFEREITITDILHEAIENWLIKNE